MVSLDPNPPTQDFYMDPMEMSFPSSNFTESTGDTVVDAYSSGVWCSEDPSKKVRKPYTITKSRESWTEQEHDKFLEALQLFDRDWKKIEAFVGSKTVIQIRSHAQKYFLKVQKNGTGEHVPPPRPKRKAAHPYPQKASKQAPVVSLITGPHALLESEYVRRPDSLSHCRSVFPNPTLSSWNPEIVAPLNVSDVTKDEMQVTRPSRANKCCSSSSNESTPRMWPSSEISDQGKGKLSKAARVVPDFAQVYSFIGSVFDPSASDHLQKLKNMDTINIETVLLLMKNLSVNLTSPEFENHRRLLSSYDVDTEKPKYNSLYNDLHIPKPQNAISAV